MKLKLTKNYRPFINCELSLPTSIASDRAGKTVTSKSNNNNARFYVLYCHTVYSFRNKSVATRRPDFLNLRKVFIALHYSRTGERDT